jgi:hypothetical protein
MRNEVAHLSLSDLQTVRVGHKGCGAVIELPLDALVKREIGRCPACNTDLIPPLGGDSALKDFAKALAEIGKLAEIEVQFVLPVDADKTPASKKLPGRN